jgi:hypothetical protein
MKGELALAALVPNLALVLASCDGGASRSGGPLAEEKGIATEEVTSIGNTYSSSAATKVSSLPSNISD